MRAIIVDDEKLARQLLRRTLESLGVEVVAEGETGLEAIALAGSHQPEVVFTDIRMPELTGMEAAAGLAELVNSPLLVFVTGYAEHAAEAYEKAAFDYVLKPVSEERLALTVRRLEQALNDREKTGKSPQTVLATVRRLPIRTDYAIRLLRVESIVCAVTKQKRVMVHTADEVFKTNYTLSQLEQLLPAEQFMRIHASAIVQLEQVEEINFLGNHTYDARLSNNQIVPIGRNNYGDFQRRLGLL